MIPDMDEMMAFSSSKEPLHFNLSTIMPHESDRFLCGIVHHLRLAIRAVTFSCNDTRFLSAERPKSGYSKEPHALILALKHGLPRCVHLRKLTLERLTLTRKQIMILGKALKSCTSLHQIFFRTISLGDDGFHTISSYFKSARLTALGFVGCALTDASVGAIKDLIFEFPGDRTCLKTLPGCFQLLDLRGNGFSYRLLLELGAVFSRTTLRVLDLRDNQPIDRQMAVNIKKAICGLEVRVNAQKCARFVPEEASPETELGQ